MQHPIEEDKIPVRKAHYVGTSEVITIDPIHVKRLAIDEMTYFIQRPMRDGIVLELRRLAQVNTNE